ncbi:MAG: ATP-binding protein [Muribaculaceae bacterium]|nr:ATP-binding protein [Muribaculaceae bacterium]
MKDIKAIRGKFYIERLIEEGEHEHQDFKFAISDARKIARSLSAFANNDGGRLLIGVKDNGNIAGVRNEEDIYMIEQAAQMYCRPVQSPDIAAFKTEGGAVVIRVEIAKSARRPVMSQEPDGSWRAYYRVKDENILAPDIMVKTWRRRQQNKGGIISMSDADSRLLSIIEERGAITLEEYYRAAHMPRASAEETLINLVSMDVVKLHLGTKGELRIES